MKVINGMKILNGTKHKIAENFLRYVRFPYMRHWFINGQKEFCLYCLNTVSVLNSLKTANIIIKEVSLIFLFSNYKYNILEVFDRF
jgi:hypothetical protein